MKYDPEIKFFHGSFCIYLLSLFAHVYDGSISTDPTPWFCLLMCSDGPTGQVAELQDKPAGKPLESRGGKEEHATENPHCTGGKN